MSGHHPFHTLRAQMTPARRARNAAQTQAWLAALPQHALQHARAQAHAELAQGPQGTPRAGATLAQQTERYVSTLRRYIEALGGRLEIVAHFPEGSVPIIHFEESDADEGPASPAGARRRGRRGTPRPACSGQPPLLW